ncbi:NigD-like protein [Bacteroidales bacterium WCE2008]|nr:NigD-like protein [Bacteroidales bacterium WCE2008]
MKLKFLIPVLLLAIPACSGDDTVYYNATAIGDVVAGRFVSDDGLVLNIKEKTCDEDFSGLDRAFISFDALRKTGDKEFDIRLNDVAKVLRKDIVFRSEPGGEERGSDPIMLNLGWFSGEYLNADVVVSFLKGSETPHLINLEFDDVNSGTDTLRFTMKHNGYGEVFGGSIDDGEKKFVLGKTYASFPVRDLIPEGMDSIPVKISWDWYGTDSDGRLTDEIISHSEVGILRR